jgi:hypothetical protein
LSEKGRFGAPFLWRYGSCRTQDKLGEGELVTDSEKIDFLAGQIGALAGFASAVMKSHRDFAALDAAFAETSARQDAVTVPSSASNEFVNGHLEMTKRLKALMAAAALRRAS